MPASSFVEFALDLLGALGPARARAMMGGHIVYCGALPVALVWEDQLFLKTDDATRGAFEAAGSEPFTYELRGKVVEMSYWSAPDDALGSAESMEPWARLALEAAARSRRKPRPPSRGRKSPRSAPKPRPKPKRSPRTRARR